MHTSPSKPSSSNNKTTEANITECLTTGTKLYIFPPDPSKSTVDVQPLPAQCIQSSTVSTISLLPAEGPTIRVHFNGPEAPYRYGRNLPPIPPSLAPRIGISVAAHRRRIASHNIDSPPRAVTSVEGTEIDLCYVDFGLDMNADITRTAFGLTLQALAPPTRTPGAREHSVTEWDIVCRRCGAVVKHYYTDKFWNGRYLAHRKDLQCKNFAVPAANASQSTRVAGRRIKRGKL